MLALVADLNPFTAGTDEILQRGVQVKRVTHLIEISHLQIGTLSDFAAVGQQFAQYQFQQRGLAGTVGADQTDLVAAQQRCAKALDDLFVPIGQRDVGQLGDDFPAGQTCVDAGLDLTHGVSSGLSGRAEFVKSRYASD